MRVMKNPKKITTNEENNQGINREISRLNIIKKERTKKGSFFINL